MGNYSQAKRQFRLDTPLGDDVLLLRGLKGEEGISRPYSFSLDLQSERASITPSQILRKKVLVTLDVAGGGQRHIHGLVSSFEQAGQLDGLAAYRMEIVPWFRFLQLSSDCRIFQDMTVPAIIETVFQDLGYSDFKPRLYKTYPRRENCVQYRETHFNFISRLMEEEGIFYFFEHEKTKHTLVLADVPAAISACPGQSEASMHSATGAPLEKDVVTELRRCSRVATTKVVLDDYNFERPTASLEASAEKTADTPHFDYPGLFQERDDGQRIARIRLEERETFADIVQGQGIVRTFQAGYRFTLKKHYAEPLNRGYVITSVKHEMNSGSYVAGESGRADYENEFEAIPDDIPFRPPRVSPKPAIHSAQTAVVTGKSGEEIWVDKYGRVKVHFFWDRYSKKDENSSMWIRVSQAWAGKNWGWIQLPRVGQEVVVSFLEGDPDRPIISGRVYNAEQMPPYTLPDNQTQSGVKSRSSKGGGGADFNELRFEDKKGSEEVYLHAQKDLTTMVENNELGTIQKNRVIKVGVDDSLNVGTNRAVSVGSADKLEVGQTIDIKAGQKITIQAGAEITIMAGSGMIKLDAMGVTIQGALVKIN